MAIPFARWSGSLRLVEPRVIHDPRRRDMPWLVRRILGVIQVDDFLEATIAATGPGGGFA